MSQYILNRRTLLHQDASVWIWWPPLEVLVSQTWSYSSAETLCFRCSYLRINMEKYHYDNMICCHWLCEHFYSAAVMVCIQISSLVPCYIPETARRVVESTGMAHCAMPRTNNSLQASSNRISCKEEEFHFSTVLCTPQWSMNSAFLNRIKYLCNSNSCVKHEGYCFPYCAQGSSFSKACDSPSF